MVVRAAAEVVGGRLTPLILGFFLWIKEGVNGAIGAFQPT